MDIVFDVMRKVIPRRLLSAVRLIAVFHGGLGHCRTDAHGLIIDGAGEHIPWFTYPAIEYLRGLDFSARRIFEFGAGASTLFWAKRAREVVSVEMDRSWYLRLRDQLPQNARLTYEPDPVKYAEAIKEDPDVFDVVVIDGAERYRAARLALCRLAPGGMIVLDNADWYPRTADMLAAAGLIEIRFSGFSPLNTFTATTALFLSRDFSIPTTPEARTPPIGAKILSTVPADDNEGQG